MAFIDTMSITEFKRRVREEARRLNSCGLSQAVSVERGPDTVQANIAHGRSNRTPRIFPGRKPNLFPACSHCGYRNHAEQDCHKHIAEQYLAKETRKAQNPIRGAGGLGGGAWRGGGGGGQGGNEKT